mgnify:FL=1
MHRKGLSISVCAYTTPHKFASIHSSKPQGKPSPQNLKAHYNHRSHCYVRR